MNNKNPISALQELMAAKKLPLPIYTEEAQGLRFKCTAKAAGIEGIGYGPNKKSAKLESAREVLNKMKAVPQLLSQIIILERSPPPQMTDKPQKNYVGELNEFSSKQNVPYPVYHEAVGSSLDQFYTKCYFLGKETVGSGMNKKDAKQNAAKQMLEIISACDTKTLILDARLNTVLPVQATSSSIPDEVVTLYRKLTIEDHATPITSNDNNNVWEAAPDIELEEEDTIDILNAKLKHYGIDYCLEFFPQKNPYVSIVKIKNTLLHFLAHGSSQEEATRKALNQALLVMKSGCCLKTNDLINFD